MTLKEQVIVSAYTGVLMCPMPDMCKHIEESLGRPIYTHELIVPQVVAEIKEKAKPDFLALCSGNKQRKD